MTELLEKAEEDTEFEEEDSQLDKYLTFQIGKEVFGIEIKHVTEIVGIQVITEIPDMPEFIRGVINLRGRVIPIVDVRLRFHMPFRDYDDRTCVIVVTHDEHAVGLVVDTVNEVAVIPEQDRCPPPRAGGACSGRFVQAMGKVGDKVKILLDLQKLLDDEGLDLENTEALIGENTI